MFTIHDLTCPNEVIPIYDPNLINEETLERLVMAQSLAREPGAEVWAWALASVYLSS